MRPLCGKRCFLYPTKTPMAMMVTRSSVEMFIQLSFGLRPDPRSAGGIKSRRVT